MVKSTHLTRDDLRKINDYIYEIPQSYRADMRVPARIFASEAMIDDVLADLAPWQLVNVATLPGIQNYAYAMPDVHQGYGFPIGGVAAMAIEEGGVISPGGIGYDINCGVRLLRSNLTHHDVKKYIDDVATAIFNTIPSGVGRGGKLVMNPTELDEVLKKGAHRMVELGYGTEGDLRHCEEDGRMHQAAPHLVSDRAKKRGADQIGTLGSGNHFLEIQYVDEIFDHQTAKAFGLEIGMVTVMIHCGSRGLGHQTCTDYVQLMMRNKDQWHINLPDRELICAPFTSDIAQQYFGAMAAACNYAWANRHAIAHWTREAWQRVMGADVRLDLVYDVTHNIGKKENHIIHGKDTPVIIHRKGATRAFGPGRPELPAAYKDVGQPVLIPGTMGSASYVLVGTEQSMDVAFGSCCHGAGRVMSRSKAKQTVRGSQLRQELAKHGVIIKSDSDPGLAEEAPEAYKDIEEVINVVHGSGLAQKVARLKPLAVVKGN